MIEFSKALKITLKHEGGYVNDPDDSGGETNYGITVSVAKNHGYTGSMKDISLSIVSEIYKKSYWDKLRLDNVDSQVVGEKVFDMAVNMGTNRAGQRN